MLIPILGYAIIFNAEVVRYLHLSKEILSAWHIFDGGDAAAPEAPISWRLLCLYFGLCLIAVGSLIYTFRCPVIVKMYPTATEYVAQVGQHVSKGLLDKIVSELYDSVFRDTVRTLTADLSLGSAYGDKRHEYLKDVLLYYFSLQNASHPTWRAAACTLYSLGFLATAVPSVDVFFRVCVLLVRAIGIV